MVFIKRGEGGGTLKDLEVKLAEVSKKDRIRGGKPSLRCESGVGSGWGGGLWGRALWFPRGGEWFRQDLEHFAGNPAGPHCSDPKWTSQELTNFVRRWGDPSPWGEPSQSNQTLPFFQRRDGLHNKVVGKTCPQVPVMFRDCPSINPPPTHPLIFLLPSVLPLVTTFYQLWALYPGEQETPMRSGDMWACGPMLVDINKALFSPHFEITWFFKAFYFILE